jgi:hypothetical protein
MSPSDVASYPIPHTYRNKSDQNIVAAMSDYRPPNQDQRASSSLGQEYNMNTLELPLRLPTPPTSQIPLSTWRSLNPLRNRTNPRPDEHQSTNEDLMIPPEAIEDAENQVNQANNPSPTHSARSSLRSFLPRSWWNENVYSFDMIPKYRRRATKGRPYITMGLLNKQSEVTAEVTLRINETQTLFDRMKQGTKYLRPWFGRTFSLKEPAGFGVYRCTSTTAAGMENLDLRADIVLDQRSDAALKRLWMEYKSRRHVDFDDGWLQWVQKGFNQDSTDPMGGMYGVQVKLKWSAKKFVYYGVAAIGLSLATGFGIALGWRKQDMSYSDSVALWQTAWTIASFVVTAAGGKLFTLVFPIRH